MAPKRKSNASQEGTESRESSAIKRQRSSSAHDLKPANSEEERQQLRDWLDAREQDPRVAQVFEVATFPVPKTKTKGRPYAGPVEQLSLGGKEHMVVAYKITDSQKWNRIPKYKKCKSLRSLYFEVSAHNLYSHTPQWRDAPSWQLCVCQPCRPHAGSHRRR